MDYQSVASGIIDRAFGKATTIGTLLERMILENEIMKALRDERDACAAISNSWGAFDVTAEINKRTSAMGTHTTPPREAMTSRRDVAGNVWSGIKRLPATAAALVCTASDPEERPSWRVRSARRSTDVC